MSSGTFSAYFSSDIQHNPPSVVRVSSLPPYRYQNTKARDISRNDNCRSDVSVDSVMSIR